MAPKRPLNNLYVEGNFQYGCIAVQDISSLSLLTANFLSAPSRLNILFQAVMEEPWKGPSHIAVHMFQLPAGQDEFDRIKEWFGDDRKQRARLPEGIPFEESTLAIANLPQGWEHTAYPRSCRDFVHIYTSADEAILIRVKSRRGNVLDHPLLKMVPDKMHIVPSQWEQLRPKVRVRKGSEQFVCSALDDLQRQEIRTLSDKARTILDISDEVQGVACVESIYRYVESVRSGTSILARGERSNLAVELGCLWGSVLRQTGLWELQVTKFSGDQTTLALFNNARTHAIAPAVVLSRILTSKRANNNLLLLHNMILAGDLPRAIDGEVTWLN